MRKWKTILTNHKNISVTREVLTFLTILPTCGYFIAVSQYSVTLAAKVEQT